MVRKMFGTLVIGLMMLAAPVGGTSAAEQGIVVKNTKLFKVHWDVKDKLNYQCTVMKGKEVQVIKRLNWFGQDLIRLKYKNCNGWTYQKYFKNS